MESNLSQLPEDWLPLSAESAREFEEELRRELPEGHVLRGRAFHAVARRRTYDDFLFELDRGEFADVHLTWRAETLPDCPRSEIHQDFAAWLARLAEDALYVSEDEPDA